MTMIHRLRHLTHALAALVLVAPAAIAQQPGSSLLNVNATASAVRVDVELVGSIRMNGVRTESVRVEAAAGTTANSSDCPALRAPHGDTTAISVSESDECQGAVDLLVTVPRRFDAMLTAPRASEVVVRDIEGRVAGMVNPELECHFKSFRGSSTCAGGRFDVRFSRGEFMMRAQE